jgi:hypothetical protein
MAEINDLSITDASNTARFPENMAPSAVNDGARALEGLVARGLKDALEGNKDSTGTQPDYAVAANRTISAYYDGMRIGFHAHAANAGGAATLNVDSVGAKAITKRHNLPLVAGDIEQHQYVDVVYSASDDTFQMQNPAAQVAAGDLKQDWINDLTAATVAAGDLVAVADVDDSNVQKKVTAQSIADLANTGPAQAAASAVIAETDEDTYVPPDLIRQSPGVAKAGVKFNTSGVIAYDFGVASIDDDGAGDWGVNFDTAFADADYVGSVTLYNSGAALATTAGIDGQAAGALEVYTQNGGNRSDAGVTAMMVLAWGTLA